MNFAAIELIVGVVALTMLVTFVWSLFAILTTPQDAWKRAQMSQMMWLAVVIFVPLIGSMLFLVAGHSRLRLASASQQATS